MALTKCKECGKEVSDQAGKCPHCGAKVEKPIGWVGIVIAAVSVVAVVQCSMVASNQPSTKPPTDPIVEARFQKTASIARAVKQAMREPESLVWETILANNDASVVCLEYRARNGFGGMNQEFIIYANNKAFKTATAWNKHCLKEMNDMMNVKYAT